MPAIQATWKNGQIVPDEPVDWPDGSRLRIEPIDQSGIVDVAEEDWSNTPEAIADWLKWYDSLEPLRLTPEEQASWQEAREAQKEFEKSVFKEHTESLRKMWE